MKRPSAAEVLLTPVLDLLSLLTIGFLAIGILGAIVRAGVPVPHASAPVDANPAASVEAARRAAEERTAVAALDATLRARMKRVAELADVLAAPAEPRHGFSAGAPIVHPGRTAASSYAIILTGDRIVPIEAPWIHAERTGTATTVRPARQGLTVEEAFRPESPLARAISAPAFRRGGRVVLLVTADSFATFRAVRDRLVRDDVDFGWEPVLGATIAFGSGPGAREVYSQSPTP